MSYFKAVQLIQEEYSSTQISQRATIIVFVEDTGWKDAVCVIP